MYIQSILSTNVKLYMVCMDCMEKKMLYKIWKLLDKQSTEKTMIRMVSGVTKILKTNTDVQQE